MKRTIVLLQALLLSVAVTAQQDAKETLSYRMEDLTSPDFEKAVALSGGVCVIPLGIIEKHGPHLPLGTDLYEAREFASRAVQKEYAVVFPSYFAGQIFEARHQPGAIAYSNELMWKMLDETCSELARNGLKKIILVNGHGGNESFLPYFCQSQLSKTRDYVVVLFQPGMSEEDQKKIGALKKAKIDEHAGESETSMMSVIAPALVDTEKLTAESGLDQQRLEALPHAYTGIWWYARFPNHFASDVNTPDKQLGELLLNTVAGQLSELIAFMKKDNTVENLQNEFFKRTEKVVATPELKDK
jgi:creatinine amidohydrolase